MNIKNKTLVILKTCIKQFEIVSIAIKEISIYSIHDVL